MSQSLSCVVLHVIFSTKNRIPMLSHSFRPTVFAYLASIARDKGACCYRVGGTEDHAHIACSLPRTITQSDLIRVLKTESTKFIRAEHDPTFAWQHGFGCFSVSSSHVTKLIAYIESQDEHHKTMSFKDEFLAFLNRYQVDYDPKYIWE